MKKIDQRKLETMFDFIKNYIYEHNGESPKFKEILRFMNMGESVGYRYLMNLKDLGLIEYSGKNTLKIEGQEKLKVQFKRLDIYGVIPCGIPEMKEQEIVGNIVLPDEWIEGECYLLKATGESMIDIGIAPGDFVLIKKTKEAHNGQIIVALTEDGSTLKRYMENKDGIRWLRAENKNYTETMRNIFPNEIVVQGVALKIIKNIE